MTAENIQLRAFTVKAASVIITRLLQIHTDKSDSGLLTGNFLKASVKFVKTKKKGDLNTNKTKQITEVKKKEHSQLCKVVKAEIKSIMVY